MQIMTKEEMDKYAYELMVKNNPDEAVKQLLLKDKENERLKEELQQEKKDFKEANDYCFELKKAIEYIEKNKQLSMFADLRKEDTHQYDLECDADDLLKILKGE